MEGLGLVPKSMLVIAMPVMAVRIPTCIALCTTMRLCPHALHNCVRVLGPISPLRMAAVLLRAEARLRAGAHEIFVRDSVVLCP